MIDKYYRKNKREIFPWVKDWTDPHNEIRYSNNIRAMSYNKWFFFHPSAYKLIFYGFNFSGIFVFDMFALLFYLKGIMIAAVVCFLLGTYFCYNLGGKLKQRKAIKDFTFYDLYLREEADEKI